MRIKLFIVILFIFISGCGRPWTPLLRGDCVDRSVAVRQSLKEQGYEAELVVGYFDTINGETLYHCWVEYKDKKTDKWIRIRTD